MTDSEYMSSSNIAAVKEPSLTAQRKNRFGTSLSRADVFKFVGLVAVFGLLIVSVIALWPFFGEIFEEGGLERLTRDIRSAGIAGVLILESVQFLQVVVAFIPGEVVQIAAGIIYGPWWGTIIILAGCIVSGAFIFLIVHKLGAPFVHDMVPNKYMDRFRSFEKSGKFNLIVFVLFLIPGMPKDAFTYITPLSDMRLSTFLLITSIARIPGIFISTYAASGLAGDSIWESLVIFAILAVIAIIVLVIYNKKIGNDQ